ncbi:MAG: hypothetical protein Aurels2KO_51470 [Aureliella sp.]
MDYPTSISKVLIVGAGWTGRQIAARMAQYGVDVWIRDRDSAVCDSAMQWISQLSSEENGEVGHGELSNQEIATRSKTTTSTDGIASSGEHFSTRVQICDGSNSDAAELVLECVPEQVSTKKRALRQLSEEFAAPTILASNSSYFVPSVLGQFVSDCSRFAHFHFHVPVLRTSVVDVSAHEETVPEVVSLLRELTSRIGHEPLVLDREHPGYIFNWLLQSVLSASMHLSAKGVASPEMIDRSWTAVTGMPLGPFGIMDQIGLDVIEHVLHNSKWAPLDVADTDQLLAIIRPMVEQGRLGTKTGAGFYNYEDEAAS